MSSQSPSVYSSIGLRRLMPTLCTNTSTPPSRSLASRDGGAGGVRVAQVGLDVVAGGDVDRLRVCALLRERGISAEPNPPAPPATTTRLSSRPNQLI